MKWFRIGFFMILFLFVVVAQISAGPDIWALDFDPSEYEDVSVLYESDTWEGIEENVYVHVNGVQVVRAGDYIGEEVAKNDVERKPFITLKVEVTAKDRPLRVDGFHLRTATGFHTYDVIEKHSSFNEEENNEINRGESKEYTLVFSGMGRTINPEQIDLMILNANVQDGAGWVGSQIPIPLSEKGVENSHQLLSGVYSDEIKDRHLFYVETLDQQEINEKQTIDRVAEITLTGYEAALLEENDVHRAKDFVISNIKPGMVALTFPVEVTFLSDRTYSFLTEPTIEIGSKTYRNISSLGSSSLSMDGKGYTRGATIVFIIDRHTWENPDSFTLQLGPVYDEKLMPVPGSNLQFHWSKEEPR